MTKSLLADALTTETKSFCKMIIRKKILQMFLNLILIL
jgi:hypothetical protein